MKCQHVRRGALSIALTGCLCGLVAGCGQRSGDEFRTYDQSVDDVRPEDVPESDLTADDRAASWADPVETVEFEASGADVASADPAETAEVGAIPESPPESESPDEVVTNAEPEVVVSEEPGEVDTEETVAETSGTDSETPAGPRTIELLVPENEFQTEGPEGAVRVSYDDIDLLKVLNMDPVPRTAPTYFPNWLNGLAGRRIRIRGFMYPPPIETGIPAFVLARDNQICCFGRNPMPYDIVPVILRDGVTTDYINGRPFDVVGVFHIGVEMKLDDPTKVKTVYYIDDAIVIDD